MGKQSQLWTKIVLQIAERIRANALRNNRVPILTGDLRKSIQQYLLGPKSAAVGSNISYARAVHDGRGEVTIRPKKAKVLAWKDPKTGQMVFRKKAVQPSREGQPFLLEAAQDVQDEGFSFLNPLLQRHGAQSLQDAIASKISINVNM